MRAVTTVFARRSTPKEFECLVHMQVVSATPETAAEIRRVVGEIDVSGILAKVTCPALIMPCAGDAIQSPERSKLIARHLPNAGFQLYDSPTHMVVPGDPIRGPAVDKFDRFLSEGESPA